MNLQKPVEPVLELSRDFDYDVLERVLRHLQPSRLHVLGTHAACSLPPALRTGGPEDDLSSILVTLTLVTDGRRGFLVLVDESGEFDAETEHTELVTEIAGPCRCGRDFVVRAATIRERSVFDRTLHLAERARVRADVERAYEQAFAGAPDVDHASFLAGFARFHFAVHDEGALRRMHE